MPEFDPLGSMTGNNNSNNTSNNTQTESSSFDSLEVKYLKSIDATLRAFVENSNRMSQSAYNTDRRRYGDYYSDYYSRDSRQGTRYRDQKQSTYMNTRRYRNSSSQTLGFFMDEFDKQFTKEFFGTDFNKEVRNASRKLANMLGVEVDEIGSTMGKYLGRQTVRVLKGSKALSEYFEKMAKFKDDSLSNIKEAFMQGVERSAKSQSIDGEMPKWYKDFQAKMNDWSSDVSKAADSSQNNGKSETSRSTNTERKDFRVDLPSIDLSDIENLLQNIQEFTHISGSTLDRISTHVLDIRDLVSGNLKGDEVRELDRTRKENSPQEDSYDKYLKASQSEKAYIDAIRRDQAREEKRQQQERARAEKRSGQKTTTEQSRSRIDKLLNFDGVVDLSVIETLLTNIQEFSHISGSKLDDIITYISDIRDLVSGNMDGEELLSLDKFRQKSPKGEDDYSKYLRTSQEQRDKEAALHREQLRQQQEKEAERQRQQAEAAQQAEQRRREEAQRATETAANQSHSQASTDDIDMSPIESALGDKIDELAGNFSGVLDKFADTKLGGLINKYIDRGGNGLGNFASQALHTLAGGGAEGAILEGLSAAAPVAAKAITDLASAATPAGLAIIGLKFAINAAITGITKIIDIWTHDLRKSWKEFTEGASDLMDSILTAGNRENESRTQQAKAEYERYKADIELMVREPFEILKDAANELYAAWDNSIRTINQTQGYSKANLQTLIGNYATRLRNEGLQAVVSSADITTNLTRVLQSGLSGTVAEEFAYLATKLSAAVPTQDWFSYASDYASLAAQMIQDGASQTEAIMYANRQLENFASSVLYASRQISGGFSTGLSNAEDLFAKSVKIANAAKSTNLTNISGEIASISAAVGAVAPDLASSLVDAVYQAAVGGNNAQIVALRSLAGINASNTEFLQAIANDPKTVFANLFDKLGEMQKMSNDNYMEVAEGLSSIFGLSMDAFSQVDFNYLADAINKMNTNSNSLDKNMDLLASGESTTTKEQEKMAQINQYMIDEGLSYVLDNEVARSIQEHMWQEQQTRQLVEATYAVEIKGNSLKFLTGLYNLVNNIASLFSFGLDKVDDIIQTVEESFEQPEAIKELLEKGKVGSGNATEFSQLTTYGKDLGLVSDAVGGILTVMDNTHALLGNYVSAESKKGDVGTLINSALTSLAGDGLGGNVASQYNWSVVGKSTAANIRDNLYRDVSKTAGSIIDDAYDSGLAQRINNQRKADTMLATMDEFLSSNREDRLYNGGKNSGYRAWKDEQEQYLKSHGVDQDFDTFMSDLGYDTSTIERKYEQMETNASIQDELKRRAREEEFWDDVQKRIDNIDDVHFPAVIDMLDKIHTQLHDFYGRWMEYVYNHMLYNNGGTGVADESETITGAYNHKEIAEVKVDESNKEYNAIYALSETLSKLGIDNLSDPVVAQNALLAQILVVVNAIMQQNNKASETTASVIPDTLSALALGITGMSTTTTTTSGSGSTAASDSILAAVGTTKSSSTKSSGKSSSKKK